MKKRSDGRYVKVITDKKSGKRLSFYGYSEREVNRKILDYTGKAESGRTFAEVADEWWGEAYERAANQSVKVYKAALARLEGDAMWDRSIADVTPRMILRFLERLAAGGFSQKTISNHKCVINQIFKRAVVSGDVQYNPCTSVQLPNCKKAEHRAAASKEDEAKVLASHDVWLFPTIALLTGMRKGEILALQWKDIDFSKKTINVCKSVEHVGDKPNLKAPKTKKGVRKVPLLKALEEILCEKKGKPTEFIISDTGKAPLTKRRYDTCWRHYVAETGIECTAHQLRHSFATIAIEKNLDPKSLQEILGHAQIGTTLDIYTDFREKSLEKARNLLDEA